MTALDIETGEILQAHPVADLFPMLADDELAELATDIAERGLLQPIMLDAEGRVLDGRNRLAACHLAGVEPRFETYDGDDPDGYALAVNIARRHLTKGQIAMVAARAAAVCDKPLSATAREHEVSKSRVVYAKIVLDHAPDLADSVISGAVSLDEAYSTARDNKRARDDRETQMLKLRGDAPDLADLVTEGTLTLPGALGELRQREAQRESELRAARANLGAVLTYLTSKSIPADRLAEQEYGDVIAEFDAAELNYAAQTMAAIAQRSNGHGKS